MQESCTMHIIARVRSDFPTKFGIPRQSGLVEELRSLLVFEPPYRDPAALRGLQGFSHLWLLWQFSALDAQAAGPAGWRPTVRPPKLGGNTRVGVFATRSPFRPNPIGLSCVRLLEVRQDPALGPVLLLGGADLMDGTPVLDIKPYLPYADCRPQATGGFAQPGGPAAAGVPPTAAPPAGLPADFGAADVSPTAAPTAGLPADFGAADVPPTAAPAADFGAADVSPTAAPAAGLPADPAAAGELTAASAAAPAVGLAANLDGSDALPGFAAAANCALPPAAGPSAALGGEGALHCALFGAAGSLPAGNAPTSFAHYDAAGRALLQVHCPPQLLAGLPPHKRAALLAVLAQDPRPAYQADAGRVYGFGFAGCEVRFSVQDDILTVHTVLPQNTAE